MVDLSTASLFMAGHARLLDRRRVDFLLDDGPPETLVAALGGYRNLDGGFGWGLEPDLRAPSSQPAGALHAFEILADVAPLTSPMAADLCDWLESVTLPDGGLPFALEGATGPVWAGADVTTSSLHITSAVCAYAHRVAEHDPAVAGHPWLRQATDHCLRGIRQLSKLAGAHEFLYALQFLDAAARVAPEAGTELERLAGLLPPSGDLAVSGGLPDEKLTPLDYSPVPDRPLRRHVAAEVIDHDLDRLAAAQLPDGGWDIDFTPASAAAAIEWRGYVTMLALVVLRDNGRLGDAQPDSGVG